MADRLGRRARRTAVALVEALLPAYGRLSQGDARTVEHAEAILRGFGPAAVPSYGVLLLVLENASRLRHGRSFSRLSRDERERLISAWSDGALAKRLLALALNVPLKVAYFDDEEIYRQKNATWRFHRSFEEPRWMRQVTRAADVDESEIECDVVIAGTGAGGAVIAKELSDRGLAVLMLEEGEYRTRADFTGSAADAFVSFYQFKAQLGAVGNTIIPIPAGRMVGGSTAINTGTCWRTPDWVLQDWSSQEGLADLSPENMAQYFARVEQQLQVEPATQPALGMVANVIARGCDELGWSHRPLNRNAPGCDGSGICDLGCPTDARRSTNISYVPPALENGAMLITGARAERVLLDDHGTAVGFEVRALESGRRFRVKARATVLACGTLITPTVLQRQGLKPPQLGRNLAIHPATTVSALFDEDIRGYAAIPQGYCVDEFHRQGILMMGASAPIDLGSAQYAFAGRKLMEVMDAYERVASFGVMVEDSPSGRVRPGLFGRPLITYKLGKRERALLRDGVVSLAKVFFAAGAREVYPAVHGHRVLRDAGDVERLARSSPRAIDWLLTAFHPTGTARMAASPARGVVDPTHQVFGVPGLYIADGSVVPSAPAVNPQVTIMALATRAADLLAARLGAPARVA